MFENCKASVSPEKCKLPSLVNGRCMFYDSSNCFPPVITKESMALPKLEVGIRMFRSTHI